MKIFLLGATGLVGKELLFLLQSYPDITLTCPSRISAQHLNRYYDVAFFCTPESISTISIPQIHADIIIDLSSAFRNDPKVPLVVPEVNQDKIFGPTLITSPNCVAAIVAVVLFPLFSLGTISKITMTTFQAVSGSGIKGIEALYDKNSTFYPESIEHNCFFHEAPHFQEEEKICRELPKIFDRPLPIEVRCIRAAIERCHCINMDVTFDKSIDISKATYLLKTAPSVQMQDSPSPLKASHKNEVFVSPPRLHRTDPTTMNLWIVGDQLRKGAAWNAYQIFTIWASNAALK